MQKYRRQIVAGFVFISLVMITVILVTGADNLAATLEVFPLALLIPVLLLKGVNWTLRYSEWRYYLGVIGVRTVRGEAESTPEHPAIRERDSAILWLAGMTLAISPGKLAEVIKALVLKNMTGAPVSRSVPVIFMERLVDGLAVIILAGVSLFFVAGSLDTGGVSVIYIRGVLFATTGALLILIAVVQYRPVSLWLLDRTATWPGLRRIHTALRNLYESTYELLRLRNLIVPVLLGVGAYFTDCIGFYLILRGLGLAHSWTLFGQAVFILGFSVIIAALSAMPGGAGGRELTVGAMLTGAVGLSRADAGTATFLISIFQVWVGVLFGLGIIAVFRRVLFPPSLEAEIAAYEAAKAVSYE